MNYPPVNQLIHPMLDLNNPHAPVPLVNWRCEDDTFNRMYPDVARMLVGEIQNKANMGPARVFFFNVYAANGYNNDYYFELLMGTMDYIRAMDAKNAGQVHLRALVPELVSMMVALMVAYQATQHYNYLAPYLDQNTMHGMEQAIRDLQMAKADIQTWQSGGFNQRSHYFGQQQQQRPMMSNGFQNAPLQRSMGSFGGGTGGFGPPPARPVGTSAGGVSAGMGRYDVDYGNQGQSDGAVDRYSTNPPTNSGQPLAQPFAARTPLATPAPMPQSAMEAPELIKVREPINKTKKLEFVSSEEQPYLVAFNNRTTESYLESDGTGAVRQVFKETEVNQADHRLPGFAPAGSVASTTAAANRTTDMLLEAIQNKAPVVEETQANYSFVMDDEPAVSLSLDECFLNTRVRREAIATANGQVPSIFTAPVACMRYVVVSHDEGIVDQQILAELADCATYEQLRQTYLANKEKLSRTIRIYLERELTNHINCVFFEQLGRPETALIDNFVEDLPPALDFMKNKIGELAYANVMDSQASSIKALLERPIPEYANSLIGDFLEKGGKKLFPEDKEPALIAFHELMTVTLVNADASELCLDFKKDAMSLLTESRTPLMYALAEHVFAVDVSDLGTIRTHYVLTNDSVVLKLVDGKLGAYAPLIRVL